MVAKATQITLFSSINELILREGHKVKMLDPFIVILDGPPTKVGFIDDFPNILEDEIVRLQVSICS